MCTTTYVYVCELPMLMNKETIDSVSTTDPIELALPGGPA